MNRVIGFLAVMLISSLPARAQHPGGGPPGGACQAAPAHGPEAFHGTPGAEPNRNFSDRLGHPNAPHVHDT